MKKKLIIKNKSLILLAAVLFLFYLWMAVQIPYTHDDWDWGTAPGLRHLLTADINSRYAGNLTEVILTRFPTVKSLVMGIAFLMLPLAAAEAAARSLSAEKITVTPLLRACIFLFMNLLILTMPSSVWRETHGWIAAFSNYVTSGLAMLVFFLVLMKSETAASPGRKHTAEDLSLFLFGAVIQLFLENLSVFFILFTVFFMAVHRNRPDVRRRLAPLLLGNLLGLIIMFSSSIYSDLLNTGSAVGKTRRLMFDPEQPIHIFLVEASRRYLRDFIPQIISRHGILAGSIAILMMLNAVLEHPRDLLFCGLGELNMIYCVHYLCGHFKKIPLLGLPYDPVTMFPKAVISISDCLFAALILGEIFLLFRSDKRSGFWLSVFWTAPSFITGPMLFVNTLEARIFYAPMLCQIVFAGLLLYHLMFRLRSRAVAMLPLFCGIVLMICMVRWIRIYEPIGKHICLREQMIETAVQNGSGQITFPEFPNSRYLFYPDPIRNKPWRINYFKAFYHIPAETEIWFESWGPGNVR